MVVLYAVTYNFPLASLFVSNDALHIIWTTPGLAMGKVYSNSMLALLNNRLAIIGGRNTTDSFSNSDICSNVRTEVEEDQTTDRSC